jgi:hypothetical protein
MVCISDIQTNSFKNPNISVIKVIFPVVISIPKITSIAPLFFWTGYKCDIDLEEAAARRERGMT